MWSVAMDTLGAGDCGRGTGSPLVAVVVPTAGQSLRDSRSSWRFTVSLCISMFVTTSVLINSLKEPSGSTPDPLARGGGKR